MNYLKLLDFKLNPITIFSILMVGISLYLFLIAKWFLIDLKWHIWIFLTQI